MKYSTRPATIKDAPGIAKVHVQSWKEAYKGIVNDAHLDNLSVKARTEKWDKILPKEGKNSWTSVAEDQNGNIVGFISGVQIEKKKFHLRMNCMPFIFFKLIKEINWAIF